MDNQLGTYGLADLLVHGFSIICCICALIYLLVIKKKGFSTHVLALMAITCFHISYSFLGVYDVLVLNDGKTTIWEAYKTKCFALLAQFTSSASMASVLIEWTLAMWVNYKDNKYSEMLAPFLRFICDWGLNYTYPRASILFHFVFNSIILGSFYPDGFRYTSWGYLYLILWESGYCLLSMAFTAHMSYLLMIALTRERKVPDIIVSEFNIEFLARLVAMGVCGVVISFLSSWSDISIYRGIFQDGLVSHTPLSLSQIYVSQGLDKLAAIYGIAGFAFCVPLLFRAKWIRNFMKRLFGRREERLPNSNVVSRKVMTESFQQKTVTGLESPKLVRYGL